MHDFGQRCPTCESTEAISCDGDALVCFAQVVIYTTGHLSTLSKLGLDWASHCSVNQSRSYHSGSLLRPTSGGHPLGAFLPTLFPMVSLGIIIIINFYHPLQHLYGAVLRRLAATFSTR